MKIPEWTTEDREFARRVHAAAQDRVPDDLLNQWTECSGAYGPRSCPALGVLLGMVRAVWGDPAITTSCFVDPVQSIPIRWAAQSSSTLFMSIAGTPDTEGDLLLAALEAKR